MTRIRSFRRALLAALLACILPSALAVDTISPDEIKPGMKGTGRSVFQGTKVETFQVEAIGVVHNAMSKMDLIMARLSGMNLEHSGIVAGMSGSPIYFEGRLAGALAYGYSFSKDPIVGITPIGQMLDVMNEDMTKKPWRRPAPLGGPDDGARALRQWWESVRVPFRAMEGVPEFLPDRNFVPDPAAMTPLASPVFVGGMPSSVLDEFRDWFHGMGMIPVTMAGVGRPGAAPVPVALEPGSSVGVAMITGDFNAAAIGTLTWLDGERFVAFGHPMDQAGPTDMPFITTHVVHIMSMLDRSFKMGYPLEVVGSLRRDRLPAIGGLLGPKPELMPLTVRVANREGGRDDTFHYEIVRDPSYQRQMVMMAVLSSIEHRERGMGPYALRIHYKLDLEGYDDLEYRNYFSGSGSYFGAVMPLMSDIGNLQTNPYQEVGLNGVEVEIEIGDSRKNTTITSLRMERERLRPGEPLVFWLELSPYDGEPYWERHELELPKLPEGTYQLLAGDSGSAQSRDQSRVPDTYVADSVPRMLEIMRKDYPNNAIYYMITNRSPGALVEGTELPDLPASVLYVHSQTTETRGTRLYVGEKVFERREPVDTLVAGSQTISFTLDESASPAAE